MEEYQSIENGLGLIALNEAVLRLEGKDTHKFLQGILSNDILLLKNGQGLASCFLSAKGKWIAALQLFQIGNSIFAKTSPQEGKTLLEAIKPLILFSESSIVDVSEDYQWILGLGAKALEFAYAEFSIPSDASAYSHHSQELEGVSFEVILNEGWRLPSFLLLLSRQSSDSFLNKLLSLKKDSPFQIISPETLEVLRIESGIPLYGKDVDEKTIPLEAGMDTYFSYTKGCYVGQETISRIKHYGRVNKRLARLKLDPKILTQVGEIVLLQDKEVGKVTSICKSPLFGNLALATLHQEANSPGTEVFVCSKGEKIKAQVLE